MVDVAAPALERAGARLADQLRTEGPLTLTFLTRFRRQPDREQATADETDDEPEARTRPRDRPVVARVITGLACLLVLFALIAPNNVSRLTPEAFLRVPLEGLLGVALILVLPGRARQGVAAVIGVFLGLLTVVKIVDMGFYAVLARPFNLVFDWPLISAGMEFLTTSVGHVGAIGVAIFVVLLIVAVLVFTTLAVLRLTRLMLRYRSQAGGTVAVLGVVWITFAAIGAQLVPGVPVAAVDVAGRIGQISTSLGDHQAFEKEAAVDAFRNTPAGQLLSGLRGKDVMFTFIESYGRSAVESPDYAKQVDAVLDAGTRKLSAAGYDSRSGWLTSPTAGGGSWLAHSTLQSGLWINNEQRYASLIKSNRLTLTRAFRTAGWSTASVMPGTTKAWPEGAFYGFQRDYDRWHLGYQGPRFNWGMPPDQYTLSAFQRFEHGKKNRPPLMVEMPLVSSHAPWAPTPSMIDWNKVGDGTVFGPMAAAGARPADVWSSPGKIRTAYRNSIEYSLNALISFVRTYGDDKLVLVFLGDHQPAPIAAGANADRDVPITIVTRDKAVLDRISGWHWQQGLKPAPHGPVWPMNAFRDKFFTAFESKAPTAR